MSSYQTVTLVTESPLPPPVNHPRSSRVWAPSSLLAHYPALAWPGISNINPLFDYLQSQLGPGEAVSLKPYITEREGEALQQTLESGDSNKTSKA